MPCVTGGGTGTYLQELAAGTHTELQPGSYLLMDGDYGANATTPNGGIPDVLPMRRARLQLLALTQTSLVSNHRPTSRASSNICDPIAAR